MRIIPIFKSVLKEDKLEERRELTLETAELSFKEIIQLFEKQECYYNIHIKNTNFTIVSKSSKSRGEVVFAS